MRREWTTGEIKILKSMYLAKKTQQEIAAALNRKQNSVHTRFRLLIISGELEERSPEEKHRILQRGIIESIKRRRMEIPSYALRC